MSDCYEPPSDFLRSIIADEVPLSGDVGEANLYRLMALTSDANIANRDWAILLLSQTDFDTAAVRVALIAATKDEDAVVRGEAILGLATRDPKTALPLVKAALRGDAVTVPMLEAAALCADPSLIADLRVWSRPSEELYLDSLAVEALEACEQVGS